MAFDFATRYADDMCASPLCQHLHRRGLFKEEQDVDATTRTRKEPGEQCKMNHAEPHRAVKDDGRCARPLWPTYDDLETMREQATRHPAQRNEVRCVGPGAACTELTTNTPKPNTNP